MLRSNSKTILLGTAALAAVLVAAYQYQNRKAESEDVTVQKVTYKSFMKAAAGVESEIAKIVEIYKKQKILVISEVPKTKELN